MSWQDKLKSAIEKGDLDKLKKFNFKQLREPLTDTGMSALVYATWKGDFESIQSITTKLGNHAEIEASYVDNAGWTLMHFACRHQETKTVKLLLQVLGNKAADICAKTNNYRSTTLHVACRNESQKLDLEAVKLVLQALGNKAAEICAKSNIYGDTPFHLVCQYQSVEAAELVLQVLGKKTSQVCSKHGKSGWTPLHIVCSKQNKKNLVQLILQNLDSMAAMVCQSSENDERKTPLHLACQYQQADTIGLLLKALGIKAVTVCAQTDRNGWTPLHYVCRYQNIEVVQLVLKALGDKVWNVLSRKTADNFSPQMLLANNFNPSCKTLDLQDLVNSMNLVKPQTEVLLKPKAMVEQKFFEKQNPMSPFEIGKNKAELIELTNNNALLIAPARGLVEKAQPESNEKFFSKLSKLKEHYQNETKKPQETVKGYAELLEKYKADEYNREAIIIARAEFNLYMAMKASTKKQKDTLISNAKTDLEQIFEKNPYNDEVSQLLEKIEEISEQKGPIISGKEWTTNSGASSIISTSASSHNIRRNSALESSGLIELNLSIQYTELNFDKRLGQGAYGEVYSGTWRYNQVAIKKLLGTNYNEEAIRELQQEAQVLAKVRSDYVVQIKGLAVQAPNYCLVMELMPKGNLYELLQSEQPLGWTQRYQLAQDIGIGLHH
ncbi:MAG: ankyrin repeat and protein kinase domain-containing protein, partial [Gammaproteobacteria bacterium]